MPPLLQFVNVSKQYQKQGQVFSALQDVNFTLEQGQTVGIIGESGSGKTTIARIAAHLTAPDDGQCLFEGTALRRHNPAIQMIFQSSRESFNPTCTMKQSLLEPLRARKVEKRTALKSIEQLFDAFGLDLAYLSRYPNQLSGGECQRIAIIRAVATSPTLLLCDEITSALDEKAKGQVLSLLQSIKQEYDITMLIISHQLEVIEAVCDSVLVLHQGTLVEQGTVADVFKHPQHPYTKLLLDANF